MDVRFFGEGVDKHIRTLFFPDYAYAGTIVEVGGGTPEFLSMSRHFKLNGWRAIIVEPNPIFAAQHREAGNEVYECACSDKEEDDADFSIFTHQTNDAAHQHTVTEHSFSCLKLKDDYLKLADGFVNTLPRRNIKVKVRRLDAIIEEAKLPTIDILTIDTEGWELEVMRGLTSVMPKLVVLENLSHNPSYEQYMDKVGYRKAASLHVNYIFERRE